MKEEKAKEDARILDLLSSQEVDAAILGQLRRIDGYAERLMAIVAGGAEASVQQRKSAVFVLGALGHKEAAPCLVSEIKDAESSVRNHSILALAAIGLDDGAKTLLKSVAGDPSSGPLEVALSIAALGKAGGPGFAEYFKKNPPSHKQDSGVRQALLQLGVV